MRAGSTASRAPAELESSRPAAWITSAPPRACSLICMRAPHDPAGVHYRTFARIRHATRVAAMSPRKGDMDTAFTHTLSGGGADLSAVLDALEAHLAEA